MVLEISKIVILKAMWDEIDKIFSKSKDTAQIYDMIFKT